MTSRFRYLVLFLIAGLIISCNQSSDYKQTGEEAFITEQDVLFRAPSSYVSQFLKSDSLDFNSINHSKFRLYFKEGSYSSNNIPELRKELSIAAKQVFEVLDVTQYPYGTYILLVDSEEEMEELMGYHIKGGAAKAHDLLFIVYNDSIRPQFKHEFFHLASYETWGLTDYRLLDEGAATYADNECYYPEPMYTITSYFHQKNQLFELEDLVADFDQLAAQNDIVAYIQSAAYFQFLYEAHGADKMKELWKRGFDSFESIYSMKLEELDAQLKEHLLSISIPEDFDEELILSTGCG